MKISYQQIINIQPALFALANQKLPEKAKYSFTRAVNQVTAALHRHAKEQNLIYKEFGELSSDGSQYVIQPALNAKVEDAQQQLTAVSNVLAANKDPVHLEPLMAAWRKSRAELEDAKIAQRDAMAPFQSAMLKLQETEVDIDFHQVAMAALGDAQVDSVIVSTLNGYMLTDLEAA